MRNPPLLPSDRYIADLLGLSEEQYRYYMAEVRRRAAEGPQPSVVATIDPATAGTLALISLISTLISVGLTIAASFFKPRSNSQQQPKLVQNQLQGQTVVDNRRYAPRQGFDSLQDVIGLGTPIPLVYANREMIDGNFYGGIRVNCPLLFSNIASLDKGQLLRAMFLISEGDAAFNIDPYNTAIGNNTLGAYLLGDSSNARYTLYYRPNGGRIVSTDRVLGTANDPGNFDNDNVFGVRNASGVIAADFCQVRRPNTQTQFGVYTLIGNGLGYRLNPTFRPIVNAQITVDAGSGGGKKSAPDVKGRIVCDRDFVAMAQRLKYAAKFSGRGCLYDATGDEWEYYLSKTTDALTEFTGGTVFVWTSRAFLANTSPFPPSVTVETITSWVTTGTPTISNITEGGATVTGTATFNQSACTAVIDAKSGETFVHNISDGSYVISYAVVFETAGKNIIIPFEVSVAVTNTTVGGVPTRTCVYTPSNASRTLTSDVSINANHVEKAGDAASAVAGRQKTWDDALQVGELYKIGAALAICTSRTPETDYFSSEADYEPITTAQGTSVTAKFKLLKAGPASAIPIADIEKDANESPPFYSATNFPHLFRVAIASFSTVRECRSVSIVIRSALGIRINGLCNFRDSLTYVEIDGRACLNKEGRKLNPGDTLSVDIFNSGQMSSSEERYSFFRVSYREAGTTGLYTTLPQCFGIRGITQQNIYNTLRLTMPSTKRWEFQIEPLSGWEIRSGNASGDLELLDSSSATFRTFMVGDIEVRFRGVDGATLNSPFMPAVSRATQGPEVFMLTSTQRGVVSATSLIAGRPYRIVSLGTTNFTAVGAAANAVGTDFVATGPGTGTGTAAPDIGLGFVDESNYSDAWGKLAESFIYEEIRSSAENGPEHEIVAVNEFVTNVTAPQYDNLAILGLNMRAGVEWQQFGQLSVYVMQGLLNTHQFPVILKDLLTNPRYGRGDMISLEQIDTESFNAAQVWCRARKYFFDGAITGKINIRQWAADVAAAHLLFFGEASGKFWLRPAWPGTVSSPSPVSFKGIFSAGNIVEGSFSMEFFEPEDRRPIQVSVRYREERLNTNLQNPGLFPVERELLVREASPNGSDSDPIESLDLSDYCTNSGHAIDAAKFIIRMRRIPDHAVKFTTTHEGVVAAIEPGDYIRVVMDITHYDDLRNGAVLADGTLVSTQPIADGTYTVLAWDGSSTSAPGQTTLTVTDGGTKATPTGCIFTLVNARTQTRTYQIERITPAEDGGFSIEAVHMPTNSSDIPLIAEGFDTQANWVITE